VPLAAVVLQGPLRGLEGQVVQEAAHDVSRHGGDRK
jgi:hypothetical protein